MAIIAKNVKGVTPSPIEVQKKFNEITTNPTDYKKVYDICSANLVEQRCKRKNKKMKCASPQTYEYKANPNSWITVQYLTKTDKFYFDNNCVITQSSRNCIKPPIPPGSLSMTVCSNDLKRGFATLINTSVHKTIGVCPSGYKYNIETDKCLNTTYNLDKIKTEVDTLISVLKNKVNYLNNIAKQTVIDPETIKLEPSPFKNEPYDIAYYLAAKDDLLNSLDIIETKIKEIEKQTVPVPAPPTPTIVPTPIPAVTEAKILGIPAGYTILGILIAFLLFRKRK